MIKPWFENVKIVAFKEDSTLESVPYSNSFWEFMKVNTGVYMDIWYGNNDRWAIGLQHSVCGKVDAEFIGLQLQDGRNDFKHAQGWVKCDHFASTVLIWR